MFYSFRNFVTALTMSLLSMTAWSQSQTNDPKATHSFTDGKVIAQRYIVMFKDSVVNPSTEANQSAAAQISIAKP